MFSNVDFGKVPNKILDNFPYEKVRYINDFKPIEFKKMPFTTKFTFGLIPIGNVTKVCYVTEIIS